MLVATFDWVSVTPFGKPVVPDEYSSEAGASAAQSMPASCASPPALQTASGAAPAGTSPSQITTCSRHGQRSRGTNCASSPTVNTTLEPESFTRNSTSAARKIALIDTVIAPIFCAAYQTTRYSGTFGRNSATRSPAATPCARSACASREAAASSSA